MVPDDAGIKGLFDVRGQLTQRLRDDSMASHSIHGIP